MFIECERCFYIAKKFKVRRDYDDEKFVLSNANNEILKDEFDKCRQAGMPHPLMINNGIAAVPFEHKNMSLWQNSNYGRGGIKFYDDTKNLIFSGVIDDMWQNQQGKFIIVDYKTTSKDIVSMEDDLGSSYRRQISFYAWLFQKNGYPMHTVGYLILDKPDKSKHSYEDVLLKRFPQDEYVFKPHSGTKNYKRQMQFKTTVLEVSIDYSWIEETLNNIALCLSQAVPPKIVKNPRTGRLCFNCETYRKQRSIEDHFNKINSV